MEYGTLHRDIGVLGPLDMGSKRGSFWGLGSGYLEGSGVRSRGRVGSETPPLYYTPRARGSVLDKSEAQKGRSIRRLIG